MPDTRLRTTLTQFGAPTAETLRFNATLREKLQGLPPPWEVDIDLMRALRAEGKGILPIDGPLPDAEWRVLDDGAGRVRLIEHSAPKGVYVHIHGGGWTFGAPEQFDGRNLRLSKAADVTVVSVQYRLAPEHKWPTCADDCEAAVLWALEHAGDLPVFIGGESAGGHLAAASLLRLREKGLLSRIRAAVLIYGCFNLRGAPALRNWGDENLILSTPIVDWFINNLISGAAQADDPLVSPLLADLHDMPPALFCVGTLDPLVDDTLFMAERWRAAGAESQLAVWPGGVHAFDYFDRPEFELPIALELQEDVANFIRARL